MIKLFISDTLGTSLEVQWLELHPSTVKSTNFIPGLGTEITHAAWHGQKKILLIIFFIFIRSLGRSLSEYQTITSLLLFGISGMGSDQGGPGWSISPGLGPSVLAAGDLTLTQYDVFKNIYASN